MIECKGSLGRQRQALPSEGGRVEHPVEQAEPAILVVADGPVDCTGGRGRHRGRDAGRAEQARRVEYESARLRARSPVRAARGGWRTSSANPGSDSAVPYALTCPTSPTIQRATSRSWMVTSVKKHSSQANTWRNM
jgi:hypothetical protein